MGEWYMAKDGKTVGPFNDEAVKSMYEKGIINSQTALWSEALGRFEPMSNNEAFKNILQNVPPPVEDKYKKEVISSTKHCPYCSISIDYEDDVCTLCSFELMAKAEKQNAAREYPHRTAAKPEKKSSSNVVAGVVIAVILLLVVISLSSTSEDEQIPPPGSGVMTTNYSRADAIAPFEMVSKRGSDHYYIKLYHYGSERLAATAFLRAGERTEFDVPPGSYELRWAVGKDWHGPSKNFGRNTNYYKSSDILRFTQTAEYVRGWVVEFELTKGGSLERTRIDEEDF